MNNSIVANSIGAYCASVLVDAASIIEDGTCNASRYGDPDLLPLASNGGRTLTHALAANSIASNTAPAVSCPNQDQRGETRSLSDGFCDVGAYELNTVDTSFYVIPLPDGRAAVIPL